MGVKSIFCTSGTLSPIDTFQAEVGITFKKQLILGHVIDTKKQLLANVIKGAQVMTYTGKKTVEPFNFEFKNRENSRLGLGVANCIKNLSSLIPNGVLIFFQSYKFINHLLELWKSAKRPNGESYYDWMNKQKPIFVEQSNKYENKKQLDGFIRHSKYKKGAIFIGVMNGKCSEGIDFSDNEARAVMVFGIPYPNFYAKEIQLKKHYLDIRTQKTSLDSLKQLSGDHWYRMVAHRSINQAIGRVIRHKNDYGSIFLVDQRLSYSSSIDLISPWIRNSIEIKEQHLLAIKQLNEFFKDKKTEDENPNKKRISMPIMPSNLSKPELLPSTTDNTQKTIEESAREARMKYTTTQKQIYRAPNRKRSPRALKIMEGMKHKYPRRSEPMPKSQGSVSSLESLLKLAKPFSNKMQEIKKKDLPSKVEVPSISQRIPEKTLSEKQDLALEIMDDDEQIEDRDLKKGIPNASKRYQELFNREKKKSSPKINVTKLRQFNFGKRLKSSSKNTKINPISAPQTQNSIIKSIMSIQGHKDPK